MSIEIAPPLIASESPKNIEVESKDSQWRTGGAPPHGPDLEDENGVTRNIYLVHVSIHLYQSSLQFSWQPAELTTAPLQALGNKKTQALNHESVFVPEGASAPEGGNYKPKKDGW